MRSGVLSTRRCPPACRPPYRCHTAWQANRSPRVHMAPDWTDHRSWWCCLCVSSSRTIVPPARRPDTCERRRGHVHHVHAGARRDTSVDEDFYLRTVRRLVDEGWLLPHHSPLVVAGGESDRDVLVASGMGS